MPRSRILYKLYAGYVTLIVLTATVIAVLGSHRVREATTVETRRTLESDTTFLADLAAPAFGNGPPGAAFQERVQRLGDRIGKRLTVIASDGTVLADSEEDPKRMDNHAARPEVQEARRTGAIGVSRRFSQPVRRDLMYLARAVRHGDEFVGTVRAAQTLATIEERVSALRSTVILGSAIAAVLACVIGWLLAKRFTGPLTSMREIAEAMAAGDSEQRVAVHSDDEVGALARAFNSMASQLDERMSGMSQERAKLRSILGSMVEGVVATDRQDRIVHINEVAAEILDLDADAAMGRPIWEATRFPRIGDTVAETMRTGLASTVEITVPRGGQDHIVQVHASALRDPESEMNGTVLLLHDVSELRRLEVMRRQFVSNVSHELKTPLTAIRGIAETMLDDVEMDFATRTRFLSRLRNQSERLSNLVSDLLNLSRLESTQQVETATFDVREPLRISVAQLTPEGEEKDLAIHVSVPDEAVSINGDAEGLRQLVDNLLHNAIQYTNNGRIDVRLRKNGKLAIIEVQDTGIGIEPQHLGRIFERFYRVDKARSRELGGTGLGLAIVKHIALAHNGNVGVESVAGEGSLFRVKLPLAG